MFENGLYMAAKVKNGDELGTFYFNQDVPNIVPPEEMHTTILFSRKPPSKDFSSVIPKLNMELKSPAMALPENLTVWKTQSGKNALILMVYCDKFKKIHSELVEEYSLSYDFPDYIPHVTISYDIGEMSIDNIDMKESFVSYSEFYAQDLDVDGK